MESEARDQAAKFHDWLNISGTPTGNRLECMHCLLSTCPVATWAAKAIAGRQGQKMPKSWNATVPPTLETRKVGRALQHT